MTLWWNIIILIIVFVVVIFIVIVIIIFIFVLILILILLLLLLNLIHNRVDQIRYVITLGLDLKVARTTPSLLSKRRVDLNLFNLVFLDIWWHLEGYELSFLHSINIIG